MQYRTDPKSGREISQLAFGCMRLPHRGPGYDVELCRKLLERAVESGVNYFDTAWLYPGNESIVGELLAPHRNKVNIATKLPALMTKSSTDFEKFFSDSMRRLRSKRIDYYMLHMLTAIEDWERFDRMGIREWADAKKRSGEIGAFGFSYHGSSGSFKKIIDSYDWDFAQVQYNYLDTERQAGTDGVRHAAEKGVPLMIMEPLRGGKLANLPPVAMSEFAKAREGRSAAEWGLRWVWNCPEVLTVLSGMNAQEQLEENLRIADDAVADAMTESDLAAIAAVKAIVMSSVKVPCTGCEYCMPCPRGVDIPDAFRYLNGDGIAKKPSKLQYALDVGILPKKPAFASQCVECGKCKTHCPQTIDIPTELKRAVPQLERFWSKPLARVAKVFTVGSRKS